LKKRLWEKRRILYGGLVELTVNGEMMLAIRTLPPSPPKPSPFAPA